MNVSREYIYDPYSVHKIKGEGQSAELMLSAQYKNFFQIASVTKFGTPKLLSDHVIKAKVQLLNCVLNML